MLYLVWFAIPSMQADVTPAQFDAFLLAPGLMALRSDETRSRVYHAVKRALPPDTALLVAPLHEAPKFKGMEPGAQAWLDSKEG